MFAWLIFVVAAVVGGNFVGTKQIDQNEANVGESRNGDRILREVGFTVDKKGENVEAQSQMVLIQSTTLTVKDPAFRAALADVRRRCAPSRRCTACIRP